MTPAGRKRKRPPNLPANIDHERVPKGVYWDKSGSGRWYVFDVSPDGRTLKRVVAGPKAAMSDLHRIAEERSGMMRGSVEHVLEAFNTSEKFKELAPRTQRDYKRYAEAICAMPTKMGQPFGKLLVSKLSPPVNQRVVEAIAKGGHPTKANHWLRYIRRCFAWGVRHGHCTSNPARGVEQAKEAADVRVPTLPEYRRVLAFAAERATRVARSSGSCAPYIPKVMQIAYLCRLRGIEVITLTDANVTDRGIATNRRKGSRDNIVRWTQELRTAIDDARRIRDGAITRHRRPVKMRAEDRPIFVSDSGEPLSKSGLDSAWQRFMKLAVSEGVITEDQRFGLHALKHRGVTDTAGNVHDKQQASGHRSERMAQRYDHSLPEVDPAGCGGNGE